MPTDTQAPPIRALFAKRLKALRVPRGFTTARSFASALDIDENRYTRYERAEVEPDLSLLVKICTLLSITPNDLLDTSPGQPLIPGFGDEAATPIHTTPDRSRASQARGLKSALAWRMAEEVAKLDEAELHHPFEKVGRVSKLYAEIDADPFSYIAGIANDPRCAALDPAAAAHLAKLAEALIAAAQDAILG